jgi:hypothetical protein
MHLYFNYFTPPKSPAPVCLLEQQEEEMSYKKDKEPGKILACKLLLKVLNDMII